VVRAGVAGALACLAWIASRPSDRWAMLLVGAAVLLAWNPYALLEPGFQLSCAAVGAIFVLVPRLERRLAGLPLTARVGPVLAVAACCGIVTAPIVWLHFGSVSVVSVPANAVAEPVVAPILALGLGAAALEPVLPDAAATLGWANGWLVAYLAWCARAFGGLGFSTVSSPAAVGGTLAGVVVLVLAVRFRRVLTRARGRVRAPALIGMGCVAVVGAVVASLHPGGSDRGPPAGLRLTFLDVGQGDSVLLETRAGAVLVDQGPPEARVAHRLRELGVERLAAVVLTHPELDHIGGAPEVVERLRVGTVLDPGQPLGSPERDRAIRDARAQGIPVVLARAGATYALGALELRVLWPEDGGRAGEDPNSHAVVLHARYGEIDALLTADAESDVLSRVRLPAAEILKVAHHGSEDPGLGAILRTVRPRVAVVSVGADNDYGHPAPTTLAALAAVPELDVYRTDLDGDVEVETDGAAVTVARSR
jgi:competence protein ComEC